MIKGPLQFKSIRAITTYLMLMFAQLILNFSQGQFMRDFFISRKDSDIVEEISNNFILIDTIINGYTVSLSFKIDSSILIS